MYPDYRAWVVDLGKHIQVVSLDMRGSGITVGLKNSLIRPMWKAGKPSSKFNVILQTYTGFKDGEGTKIYEGDILQDHHGNTVIATWDYEYGIWEDEQDNPLYELVHTSIIVGHTHDGQAYT